MAENNVLDSHKKDSKESKKKEIFPYALFVLYGDGNKGKTTSLTELLFKLIGDPTIIGKLKSRIINSKTKKYKNGCYVIFYKGKWIFMSTWGDDRKSSELNINFFYGISVQKKIFVIDNNGLGQLKRGTAYTLHHPDICITASHGDGTSLPPTLYMANKQLEPCHWQIWKHKKGDALQNARNEDGILVTSEDIEVAKELKSMIDDYVIKVKEEKLVCK